MKQMEMVVGRCARHCVSNDTLNFPPPGSLGFLGDHCCLANTPLCDSSPLFHIISYHRQETKESVIFRSRCSKGYCKTKDCYEVRRSPPSPPYSNSHKKNAISARSVIESRRRFSVMSVIDQGRSSCVARSISKESDCEMIRNCRKR